MTAKAPRRPRPPRRGDARRARSVAEKTGRSRTWLVTGAIEDNVALNAWQIGRIEAGVVAADRGDFASDQDVERVRKTFAGGG